MFDQIPAELRNAGPGIAGSAVALFFMRRSPLIMAGIFIGGCLVSYYGTGWVSAQFEMEKADGLVGFLLGLFAMATAGKVFDTIDAISPSELWLAVRDFVRKRLGV